MGVAPERAESVRTAEVIAALCLATDLGMAFPFEHGLHTTLIAMRLADKLGVDQLAASETYYASLLAHAGCTTEAHLAAEVFGGSLTVNLHPVVYGTTREVMRGLLRALPDPDTRTLVRFTQTARRLPRVAREQRPVLSSACEVAGMLADRVGAPSSVPELLAQLTERWDGRGPLRRAKGEEIHLPMRIVHVATDAAYQYLLGGVDHAARLLNERAGHAFDPEVAACCAEHASELLAIGEGGSSWEDVLASEPFPQLALEGESVDRALRAMGSFSDLVSPYLSGHSIGVGELAGAAADRCGLDAPGAIATRRAGFVHDLGRVAVHPRVWNKPGPLTSDEWEQVRLHPYHVERVLFRSPFFAELCATAGRHHERLDGSGYHRGVNGSALGLPARLLAAADAYHAMTEPRPHRAAHAPEKAARLLADEVRAGRLDAHAVAAVLDAVGQRTPRIEHPAGLTDREVEVVALLARGLQTKQVARDLGISAKTADRHIQNAYRKIGVSSRAAATVFAMEHGLVAWGGLPIPTEASRP